MNPFSRRNGKSKYAYLAAAIVVLLALWVSVPLMDRSSLDASVPVQYRGRQVNMMSIVQPESSVPAPGGPIAESADSSGAKDESALFSSSGGEVRFDEGAKTGSASASASAGSAGGANPSGGSGGGAAAGVAKKLNAVAALGGTSGGTSSMGSGNSSKFFGSGNEKANLAGEKYGVKDSKVPGANSGKMLAMLQKTENASQKAAGKNGDDAKGLASGAFDSSKANADLNGDLENTSAQSGLDMDKANVDLKNLKKNEDTLNNKKITVPDPGEAAESEESSEEQMKQMIMQICVQSVLGSVFGAVGSSIGSMINPKMKYSYDNSGSHFKEDNGG